MNAFLAQFITYLTTILSLAIILRALLSWFPISPSNPIFSLLVLLTEPILAPLRRVVPRLGFLDLSPLVAILLLALVRQVAVAALL